MRRQDKLVALVTTLFFGGILAAIFLFPDENFKTGMEDKNVMLDRGSYFLAKPTHIVNLYFKKEMKMASVKNVKNYTVTHVKRNRFTRDWEPVEKKLQKKVTLGLPTWEKDTFNPERQEMTLTLPFATKPEAKELDAFMIEARNLEAKNGEKLKQVDQIIVYVPKYFKFRQK